MHSVLHTVLHDVLYERDAGGSRSSRRWEDEPPRTSPGPMTGRTSELGVIGRGPTSASTAWAVPGYADAPGPERTARRLRSARCQRASGGLVTATRCRADASAMTASAAPRARRCGRRSKRDQMHRSVRLRCHRVRRGRLVVCHQVVAERSGDVRPAWAPQVNRASLGCLSSTFGNSASRTKTLVNRLNRGVYEVSRRPESTALRDDRGSVVGTVETAQTFLTAAGWAWTARSCGRRWSKPESLWMKPATVRRERIELARLALGWARERTSRASSVPRLRFVDGWRGTGVRRLSWPR